MRILFSVLGLCLCAAPVQAAPAKQASGLRGELPSSAKVQEALGEAAKALARQRDELIEEKRRLDQLKDEIRGEIKRLQDIQKSLKTPLNAQLAQQVKQRSARVRRIAKSLACMSPQAASVAFSHMDDSLAVELLLFMNGKQVGMILEAMEAGRAAKLMQAVVGQQVEDK